MVTIQQLLSYLDQQLQPQLWRDYCPNGLQIAGSEQVKHLLTAVTASQEVLETAVQVKAQAILVHHGYFWRGDDPCILGIKKKRLTTLLKNDINLIAYHLPLDGHGEWGNNVQLGRLLDLHITGEFAYQCGPALALSGQLPMAMSGGEFAIYLQQKLNRVPFHIPGRADKIKQLAWCTGAGQDLLAEAIDQGADAFLTGEVSERTVYLAREAGIHFFAAGHHATERYGVKALGEHLAEQFAITHQYFELNNPI